MRIRLSLGLTREREREREREIYWIKIKVRLMNALKVFANRLFLKSFYTTFIKNIKSSQNIYKKKIYKKFLKIFSKLMP